MSRERRRCQFVAFVVQQLSVHTHTHVHTLSVASLGGCGGGGGPPRVTPSRGVIDTRRKKCCGQIYKEYWRNEVGDVKKVTPHPGGGDTRVKAIKSDSDGDSDEQKWSPGFSGKNRGLTGSVAARVSPTLVTPLHTVSALRRRRRAVCVHLLFNNQQVNIDAPPSKCQPRNYKRARLAWRAASSGANCHIF